MAAWLVGVDTGGTFTDLIAFETSSGRLHRAKVPSVPADPSVAVLDALHKLFAEGVQPAEVSMFVHGTTVATNALLEGKGVTTGLLIVQYVATKYTVTPQEIARANAKLDQQGFMLIAVMLVAVLVGAGGHFCPVARWLSPPIEGLPVVVAQEAEF